jgi:hypothetical protein
VRCQWRLSGGFQLAAPFCIQPQARMTEDRRGRPIGLRPWRRVIVMCATCRDRRFLPPGASSKVPCPERSPAHVPSLRRVAAPGAIIPFRLPGIYATCPRLVDFKPVLECPMNQPPNAGTRKDERGTGSFDPRAAILNPYVCEDHTGRTNSQSRPRIPATARLGVKYDVTFRVAADVFHTSERLLTTI